MFYIYHIPGVKIGVTSDIQSRVVNVQGYKDGEYEILESSDCISYISDREIILQKEYGYKVDRTLYKDLVFNKKPNNMISSDANTSVTFTKATSTFNFKQEDAPEMLKSMIGVEWETENGIKVINETTIPWIINNLHISQFNKDKCYFYNKKYENFMENNNPTWDREEQQTTLPQNRFQDIRNWAQERGLYDKGDVKTQYIKLQEETGEIAKAIIKKDREELLDGIGDAVVVLTNLAHLAGTSIEHCIELAYNEIKNRKGSMKNGSFIKEEL